MKGEQSQFEWKQLAAEWRAKNQPSGDLEARLVEEFRRRRPAPGFQVWRLAAVAAMLLAIGSAVWSLRPGPMPPVAVHYPPPPVEIPVAAPPKPVQVAAKAPKARPPRQPVIPASNASTRESYTEFFPLEEGPVSIDRGRVVRVRMPRSAMFQVGLPVNMNRMNDAIQADLVLSEDGIARAVRFVQ